MKKRHPIPFSGDVTPLDWVFQHWSPRTVTSRHKDYYLTKRAVVDRAVRKKARQSTVGLPQTTTGVSSQGLATQTIREAYVIEG